MASDDPGINKPFDRIFKAYAEEDPALFVRLLEIVPAEVDPDIQPLRLETAPAVVLPDYVAAVRVNNAGDRIIFHAEFESSYSADLPANMARYGGSLAWQYQMTVISVLILLRPKGVPAVVHDIGCYRIGLTETRHPFKVVRLWELDPSGVLATGNPKLLPWVVLMRSTDEQVREIAAAIKHQDDDTVNRFVTLACVRYHRDVVAAMLGKGRMGLIRAIRESSSLFVEERAEGREEGRYEGRAEEARKLVRRFLQHRFAEFGPVPELESISDVETLELLADTIIDAQDAESVRNAIRTAGK